MKHSGMIRRLVNGRLPSRLSEDNLIILGNSRSNPKMQSLQDSDGYRRQFRYRMEDKHIVIRNLSPDEAAILESTSATTNA